MCLNRLQKNSADFYKSLMIGLLIIVIGLFSQSYSQTIQVININQNENDVRINFISTAESFISKINDKNYFDFDLSMDESMPGKPIIPSRIFIVAIPPNSGVSAELKNSVVKVFDQAQLKVNPKISMNPDSTLNYQDVDISSDYLTSDFFPAKEVEVIKYFWLRDFYCAAVKVNPVRFNWKNKSLNLIQSAELDINFFNIKPFNENTSTLGEFDKDLKDVIINFQSAQNFRTNHLVGLYLDSLGSWIDYSKTYYKLAVIKDGIYRISYDNLISYGIIPSTINPKTIKIYRKGKQLPIFVSGEEDLVFDQSDFIEFWCEKNYGYGDYRDIVQQGEDYINYMDRYSDTSMVWLTFGGDIGNRIQILSNNTVVTTDTINNHLSRQHLENDLRLWYYSPDDARTQLPFWQENKVFTWLIIGNSGSQDITFNANNFIPDTPVKTNARLISNSGDVTLNAHKHGASLNSTVPQDTIIYNYRQTVNFISSFNSNQLLEGSNTYRLFGLPTAASFHRSLVDWVDIEYLQENKADNDSIVIIIADSVSFDFRNIRIKNINTPDSLIVIYKIGGESKKIINFTHTNDILIFSDSLKTGDKYIVTKQGNLLTPSFKYSGGFANLRDITRGADYIIVTHKSLAQSTQEYQQFISNNYSARVERIFVEDIYDEFSFGQNWADAIKYFLIYAKDNWVSPAPSFLNLIGDANYDYKNAWNPAPSPRKKNLVPSYGFPVSDIWYVTWDSTNINIPQMYVGRIPANNDSEVRNYLTKHQNYLGRRLDDWNKRYILYSGGDPTKVSELLQIKNANDLLLNNYLKPNPIGGNAIHFYKTIDPSTNFGPYDLNFIKNTVDSSGLFISYIGHSGTRTWDNGITEVEDIKNAFQDRYPLISDFGCSTGKFAEPDVDAFGELFVCQSSNGQAIGYLGNSSLGYFSTSLRFPELFYKKILIDSITTISKAHLLAKIDQFNFSGYNDVNKVFNYCNLLFSDPILQLSLPSKPNFVVNSASILLPEQISDQDDSIAVKIKINNWGKVIEDSLVCIIINNYNNQITFSDTFKIPCPKYEQILLINIGVNELVGSHKISVQLDPLNQIEEIYEDDNFQELYYSVYSSAIRPIEIENYYATKLDTISFLNPSFADQNLPANFIFSISSNKEFINAVEYNVDFDTVISKVFSTNLVSNNRYWYRTKVNLPSSQWSPAYSFKNTNGKFTWFINADHKSSDINLNKTEFDSTDNTWKLGKILNQLKITSAGSNDGKFASILFNNQEKLPNTFFWGMASAEIDTTNYEPYNIKYYAYPNTIGQNSDSLINYINSLPEGKMLALAICDDAAQTVLGFGGGTPVRIAIETLGSYFIDSVRYRESWCMLGVKGAPTGSVPESYKKLFEGFANVDSSKFSVADEGSLTFPIIGNSSHWQNVVLSDSIPMGSSLEVFPIGVKSTGEQDTLAVLNFNNSSASIESISSVIYPEIKLHARFSANQFNESPKLRSIGTNFIPPPELAINYQVVTIDNDTIPAGGNINLSFWVYNVGEANADSFNVKVDVVNQNNTSSTIFNEMVTSLAANSKRKFDISYQATGSDSEKRFLLNIDPENKINEYFEDNNFFTKSFYIKTDAVPPVVKIMFDDNEVVNGDFVSKNPDIKIILSDESPVPIIDPNLVKVYLNIEEVNRQELIDSSFSINQTISYRPTLEDGDYLLSVIAKDNNGNTDTSEVYFVVSSQTKLMEVYNYPNPFANETYFTFRLSQIPEEIKIRIYTIAGRMIKEITKRSSELNYDLNKIYWNGRDEDGDVIANGTYLYKMIMKNADKSESVTQKLVIVK